MNYKNKYIKYKLKYSVLKKQYGGHDNEYSVYLVPWDYSGISNSWFEKWGGKKPHATLAKFEYYPGIQLKDTIKNAAIGNGNKRWIFGNRNYEIKQSGNKTIMYFKSNTIDKLKLNGLNTNNKLGNNLHITLGENLNEQKITTIISNLIQCQDWRLILVKKDKNKVISWKENYELYD